MVSSGRRKFIIRRFDNVMPRKNALPQAKSSMVTGSLGITQSSGLDVHTLIHATKEETVKKLLVTLQLDKKQLEKVNKLRNLLHLNEILQ